MAGIQSITVTETQGTGDLTLRTQEAGLNCNNQANEVTVSSASSFWVQFCTDGTTTIRIAEEADTSNYRDYTITMSPEPNRAPEFSTATVTREVAENSAANANVGAPVTATDPNNDTLTYSITDAAGNFSIVPASGRIRVASGASLDYEGTNSYTVTVTATDPEGLDDTVSVTINLTDVGPSVTAVTVSNIAETSARVTGTLAEASDGTTSYSRHRAGGGAWSQYSSAETEGGSAVHDVTGLAKDTNHTVAVSTETSFGTATTRTANFRTLANSPPVFPSASTTRGTHNHAAAGTAVGAPVAAADTDALTYTMGGHRRSVVRDRYRQRTDHREGRHRTRLDGKSGLQRHGDR